MEATLNRKTSAKEAPAPRWLVSDMEQLDQSLEKVVLRLGRPSKSAVLIVKRNYKLGDRATISHHIESLSRHVERLKELLEPFQIRSAKNNGDRGIEQLIDNQTLVTSAELLERLDWSRQALSKALTANRVFYVEHKGTRFFPAFFADSKYERKQLEAVSKILGELPGSAKLQFFLTAKGSLGGVTPLEALSAGKLAAVKTAAQGFAER